MSEDVLTNFCKLWKLADDPGPLSRLLCPRNMMILVQGNLNNSSLVWEKFGRIIVHTITSDILSVSLFEAQAVAFFRYCWPNVSNFKNICVFIYYVTCG